MTNGVMNACLGPRGQLKMTNGVMNACLRPAGQLKMSNDVRVARIAISTRLDRGGP
jgi:hypothetical protein